MTKHRADCTVRALALVAHLSYAAAEDIAAAGGRKPGRTANSFRIMPTAKKHGLPFYKLRFNGHTLATFLRRYPIGRYYVSVRGHALAVIDGLKSDLTPLGCIVIGAWELKEPSGNPT